MKRATKDSHQIFQVVRDYLGPLEPLVPDSWLGNGVLDRLWNLRDGDSASWPCDVLELCGQLDINLDRSDEMWTTIEVTKEFGFSLFRRGETRFCLPNETFHLAAEEVKEYLENDAVARARKPATSTTIQEALQTALKALEGLTEDGFISVKSYLRFAHHTWERHSSAIGDNLKLYLLHDFPSNRLARSPTDSPISLRVSYKVPYKPRFGFVNIEYLRWLAPPSLDPEIFRPFLESCLEIRGLPAAQGVYIPVTYLNDGIFEALRLRFDARQVVEKRDKSLDEYTHNNWYLLAPTESSDLYPVRRETQRMHFRSAEMSLAQFLKEYFPKNTYLDSQIPHKPEWLVMPNRVEQRLGSCQGSVSLDSSRHRFRFGKGR
jgi:hypothetical protein